MNNINSIIEITNNSITPANWQEIKNIYNKLVRMNQKFNWHVFPYVGFVVSDFKNDMTYTSQIISTEYPYLSTELYTLKDKVFLHIGNGYSNINPRIFGQIFEIFKVLINESNHPTRYIWDFVHPSISFVSKQLYLNGHYANAAVDAFIEINARLKKIYHVIAPDATKKPDGDSIITTIFSLNNPMLKIDDLLTESGNNEQKGLMLMLRGAIAALRNPKAHENIAISADDAMRRIMFASMLMYKIDDAVNYTNIKEN